MDTSRTEKGPVTETNLVVVERTIGTFKYECQPNVRVTPHGYSCSYDVGGRFLGDSGGFRR